MDKGLILKFSLKVPLSIPYSSTKNIKHLGFFREEVIIINAEFSSHLDPLVLKSGVYSIRQW